MMKKIMGRMAFFSSASMIISIFLYSFLSYEIFLSLAITFGTISYHLLMRFLVSLLICLSMKKRFDIENRWFRVGDGEWLFYRMIKVRRWKDKLPTYDMDQYNPRKHTWSEIAQSTCRSELIHEISGLLSFLPILFGVWFGAFYVFILTSFLSALFDLVFIILQRYNRYRIVMLLARKSTC